MGSSVQGNLSVFLLCLFNCSENIEEVLGKCKGHAAGSHRHDEILALLKINKSLVNS